MKQADINSRIPSSHPNFFKYFSLCLRWEWVLRALFVEGSYFYITLWCSFLSAWCWNGPRKTVRCCVKVWLDWNTKVLEPRRFSCCAPYLSLRLLMTWSESRWEPRWTSIKTSRQKVPLGVRLQTGRLWQWWELAELQWGCSCKFIVVLPLKSGFCPPAAPLKLN